MTFEEIKNLLVEKFGPEIIVSENGLPNMPYVVVPAEKLPEICLELHDHEQLYFDFLSCQTGIDNGPEAETLEVVYNLNSIPFGHSFCLKVIVPRNSETEPLPQIPTVSHIWRTADWHEREIFDLIGISFTGHPDMRRILCAADWQGHPLRKDYVWPEFYHDIKVPYDQHNEQNGFRGERW
ncbi:MAG TPA: NADH-quinone oxidoreductase subunit C [Adhaeribacter sp.]|nr:NADH-quinone oxidoreductase subunit C [Adhaeribacter sp.]